MIKRLSNIKRGREIFPSTQQLLEEYSKAFWNASPIYLEALAGENNPDSAAEYFMLQFPSLKIYLVAGGWYAKKN